MQEDYYKRQNELLGVRNIQKIQDGRVAVFGIGGSGAAVSECLVRLGIGTLLLVDPDIVEESNLNRQILFSMANVGKLKVQVAANRLNDENPNVCISTRELVKIEEIESVIMDFDVIVDCCDDHIFKVALSRSAKLLGKPLVHTSAFGFRGCVTVFKNEPTYEQFFELPSQGKPTEALKPSDFNSYRKVVIKKVGSGMYSKQLTDRIADGNISWQTLVSTPVVASGLVLMQVLRLLTGDFGKPVIAPSILRFDLLRDEYIVEQH